MTRMLGEAGDYAAAVWPDAPVNVAGGGMPPVWVAGVDPQTAMIVHVEYVPDPTSSPLVEGSSAPDVVRRAAVVDLLAVFGRYREVIEDEANPLRGVRTFTNAPAAIPALAWVQNESGCAGAIEVRLPGE